MKKIYRILSLALALCLCLSLAACGGKTGGTDSKGGDTPAPGDSDMTEEEVKALV